MIIIDEQVLRRKSKKTSAKECKKKNIFERLEEDLNNSIVSGLGLAAIQIGEEIKASIIRFEDGSILKVINPVIIEKSNPIQFKGEGCLSFPKQYINTNRYNNVVAEWLDEKGKKHKADFNGIEAVVLQHEIDHMEGVLYFDRKLKPIVREGKKIGRNETCPCGSNKKYKKCCGQ